MYEVEAFFSLVFGLEEQMFYKFSTVREDVYEGTRAWIASYIE